GAQRDAYSSSRRSWVGGRAPTGTVGRSIVRGGAAPCRSTASAPSAERNSVESLLPLLLIFAVMMLPLLWMSSRQRKAQQKHLELVRQLGVGDEVRTHSGFFGLIVEAYDDVVVL